MKKWRDSFQEKGTVRSDRFSGLRPAKAVTTNQKTPNDYLNSYVTFKLMIL